MADIKIVKTVGTGKDAEKWLIDVQPAMGAEQMAEIRILTGKGHNCKEPGAGVAGIEPNMITIGLWVACDKCANALLNSILVRFGKVKSITYLIEK